MATPPTPKDHPTSPPPPLLALPSTTKNTLSPPKKIPPLPWTHQETTNLIQAYQEKWYSLKKGQLKASQWEEVSVTVAARCDYDEPSKSSTQCRHKIEKLRKRYRDEKKKMKPHHHHHPKSWQFFDLMDRLEHGPLPISAHPSASVSYPKPGPIDENEESSDEGVSYHHDGNRNKSRSVNHIFHASAKNRNLGSGKDRVLRDPLNRKRKECFESEESGDEEEEEEEERNGVGKRDMVVELANEIRGFVERFVNMENKKIEMMRETERLRMEMENKKMEMILESQMKIVDTIGRAFGSQKQKKMGQGI